MYIMQTRDDDAIVPRSMFWSDDLMINEFTVDLPVHVRYMQLSYM